MARRARVLDNLEREAVASLNPRQLRGMGLDAGDMVKVATRRGEIALKVRADGDVPEGMVFIPFRSEAHTSELQSLMRISYAIFCLKKKMTRSKQSKKYLTHV